MMGLAEAGRLVIERGPAPEEKDAGVGVVGAAKGQQPLSLCVVPILQSTHTNDLAPIGTLSRATKATTTTNTPSKNKNKNKRQQR